MTMPILFAHGATGGVAVQGYAATATTIPTTQVLLQIKSWESTETKAEHDTGNTSTPGYTSTQPGKKTLSFTIEAQLKLASSATAYDETVNPISASGPNLGAEYCSVLLAGGTTSNGAALTGISSSSATILYNIPTAVISSFKLTNKEGDIMTYAITGKSSGAYVANGGL